MKRAALLAIFAAHVASAAYVQAVEFPYDSYPRQFWERELVWLKNIGIGNVAIQPNQAGAGDLLDILRRLAISAAPAPAPAQRVSAVAADALVRSREILAEGKGSLVWTDVESTLRPFRKGAIAFNGEEAPSLAALRRDAALLRYWGELFHAVGVSDVRPVGGKFPEGVTARQLLFPVSGASAVSIVNRGKTAWQGDLRVMYPPLKRFVSLPGVQIPANEALWLPVGIPLADPMLCKDCAGLGNVDRLVYATAELTGVEYENGILAMEFAAPAAGEVILQLAHEPSGPLLAAAKPTNFDWDDKTSRVRLAIPAGKGPEHRVRIALAIQAPDSSAFFVDARPLIIGRANRIATSYSSEEIAKRSRLRLSVAWKLRQEIKSPTEIDYLLEVPANALHGDHVQVELEADGVRMSHARLQLLRAASLGVREALGLHFGSGEELPVTPPLVPFDQKAGRDIGVLIRNNFAEIRNYALELTSPDLEFSPAKMEVSIGASMEREVSVRVFGGEAGPGPHPALIRLSGPASVELPVVFVAIPRNETVAYGADLDGDKRLEYVLESQKARAVFSGPGGGRWMEFVWKDANRNLLPEAGVDVGAARLSLRGAELTIEKDSPLPPEALKSGKRGDIQFDVRRPSPNRAVYTLSR